MHGSVAHQNTAPSLGTEAPFSLGDTLIDPSTRMLMGPGGATLVEPRVMQVLVMLARSAGRVVTRDSLLAECWSGRFVGEDALNRAVGEVRRLARTYAANDFAVETIPKTGYRLTGAAPVPLPQPTAPNDVANTGHPLSRRAALVGGGMALCAIAGVWHLQPRPANSRAETLFDEAGLILRNEAPAFERRAVALLEEARSLAPDDPRIAGRLSLARQAAFERAPPAEADKALEAALRAAQQALALDAKQPEARVVEATIAPAYGDWLRVERLLRSVLADHPDNPTAKAALATLMMSVGRVRACIAINLPLAEAELLSPVVQYRRVYNLWNLGRHNEMDRVADRAMQLWPRHPGVWFVRLWTLAYTGRPELALAMLEDAEARPAIPAADLTLLRRSLMAMNGASAVEVARVADAQVEASRSSAVAAINAVMILSRLGAMNAAFDVANGYLDRQGPAAGPIRVGAAQPVNKEQRQRKTMMLFVPVTAPMRGDPRFGPLCDAIGLANYWRQSGERPDYQIV